MRNPIPLIKEWLHLCSEFRWDLGYGYTKWGLGTYEYEVCQDCKKPTGKNKNFKRDTEC